MPRVARHREIEAAPEELDRARFADEAGLEGLEHAIGLNQRAPQQLRMLRVVRVVPFVQVERDGVGDLHGTGRDRDVDAAASEPRQEVAVEARDRARLEAHREGSRVAVGDVQTVVDEVEVDLELAVAVRDR